MNVVAAPPSYIPSSSSAPTRSNAPANTYSNSAANAPANASTYSVGISHSDPRLGHKESPLASLVRRTSSRRARDTPGGTNQQGYGQQQQSAWRGGDEQQQRQQRERQYQYQNQPRQPEHQYADRDRGGGSGSGSGSKEFGPEEQYTNYDGYASYPTNGASSYTNANANPSSTKQSRSRSVSPNPQPQPASSHPYASAASPYPSSPTTPTYNTTSNDTLTPPPRRGPGNNLQLDLQPNARIGALSSENLHSPLLHSHFARDSVATVSDVDRSFTYSYYEDQEGYDDFDARHASSATRSSRGAVRDTHGSEMQEYRDRYFVSGDDASSVYSSATVGRGSTTLGVQGPALRDSWRSTETGGTVRRPDYYHPPEDVPTVVVSDASASSDQHQQDEFTMGSSRGGRAPIVKPMTANFSRPVREVAGSEQAEGERVMVQLPVEMREQKKVVLERNAGRSTPGGGGTPGQSSIGGSGYSRSPLGREADSYFGDTGSRPSMESRAAPPQLLQTRSDGALRVQTQTQTQSRPGMVQTQSLRPISARDQQVTSPVSLYSTYSYYQYDGVVPSPTGSDFQSKTPEPRSSSRPASRSRTPDPASTNEGTRTPQDYLQLGIQHHEANRLSESARCFERSAKESGGCGVGMLMYGLALRHGWGCQKNEALGFKWVQKAAESAVGDLEKMRTTQSMNIDPGAVQTELVLAIYEVGQCFFHGWGVGKDQKMGVSYYQVAAQLGDGDAQADLAFCLANGKGCKKDKKEAAKWYRAAVSQGQSDVGLAWIYKEKYQ